MWRAYWSICGHSWLGYAALFEQYRTDINDEIANLKPHSLRWYVEKVKAYQEQDGTPDKLPTDEYGQVNSDTYAAIAEERRIVKYASAQEVNGQIAIKVAGISDGEPCQIKDKSLLNIKYYMSQIKDAGVPVSVNTYPADKIKLTVAIYYNPLKINEEEVKTQVVAAVKQAVKNLPFNGDCKTSDLLDAIRAIDGIEVADILTFQAGAAYGEYINVSGYYTPVSGYFTIGKHNIDFSILQPYANGQQI